MHIASCKLQVPIIMLLWGQIEGSEMNQEDFEKPIVTVDIVLLTIKDNSLFVVTQRRDKAPFEGKLALIGGFIHADKDKTSRDTVNRVLKAKAGLSDVYSEQLQTFASNIRDPRGWSVSIAYIALVSLERIQASSARDSFKLLKVEDGPSLPFDHEDILNTALHRIRGKGAYSTLPSQLLGDRFTLPALREVYDVVTGSKLDDSSFRRKMTELDLIEETDEFEPAQPRKRPGRLYRLKSGVVTFDKKI